jgi:hypothetical protein
LVYDLLIEAVSAADSQSARFDDWQPLAVAALVADQQRDLSLSDHQCLPVLVLPARCR